MPILDSRTMRWCFWLFAMTVVGLMLAPGFSHASPSFLCGPKLNHIEKAICTDADLAALDSSLAWTYEKLMATSTSDLRAALRTEQRAWLASRETLCPSEDPTACLKALYGKRVAALNESHPGHEQGFDETQGSHIALVSGTTAAFSGMEETCESDHVSMRFYEPDDTDHPRPVNRLSGNGYLDASFADCQLNDGSSIRIKAGYRDAPMAYSICGGSPEFQLSIWVNQHKTVSALTYSRNCESPYVSSMSIDRKSIGFCLKDDAIDETEREKILKVEHGSCGHIIEAAGTDPDRDEFPAPGVTLPPVGSFSLISNGAIGEVCEKMITKQQGYQGLSVPPDMAHPNWQPVDTRNLPRPDLSNIGYNATTLARGELFAADFDLTNTGVVSRIYQSDQETHWFDGSAFAVDREGILATPFDAHDWDASIKKGIYSFVYQHASVFFFQGKTYLLLHPVNAKNDATVNELHDQTISTVCTFKRRAENF
ncbi:lysozyme inhibitor LprI family protein [Luteibacter sp. Lutesp34]|uniref:lysozyme inhibitor LprI family protein n=1 Tax=Luteibacter sp. Lutesp34 TaxID=3243030 RepID=UPI0039B422DA